MPHQPVEIKDKGGGKSTSTRRKKYRGGKTTESSSVNHVAQPFAPQPSAQ